MQSDRAEEHKAEISPFQMIYDAAIEQDSVKLSTALHIVCIDVWNKTKYGTPIAALAYQGNVAAVNFLLENGASPGHAADGYARGGHTEALNALLERIDKECPGKLTSVLENATYGFARNQDAAKLHAFWQKIQKEHRAKIPKLLRSLAMGYAYKGSMESAKKILKDAAEKNYPATILSEIKEGINMGLALSGNVKEINIFLNQTTSINPDEDFNLKKIIILFLTLGGYSDRITTENFSWYTKKYSRYITAGLAGNGIDNLTDDALAKAFGFAAGGYKEKAKTYGALTSYNFYDDQTQTTTERHDQAPSLHVVKGFATSGHLDAAFDYFKENLQHLPYLTQKSLESIAEAFAINNSVEEATLFIKKMKNEKLSKKSISLMRAYVTSFFYQKGNHDEAFYLLRQKPVHQALLDMMSLLKPEDRLSCLNTTLIKLPSLTASALVRYLEYPNIDQTVVLKAVLTIKGLSVLPPKHPTGIPTYLCPLIKRAGYNLDTLMSEVMKAERDALRLGFTTLSQLCAWRDPAIRFLLSSHFPEGLISDVITKIVTFLSPTPPAQAKALVSYITNNRELFFKSCEFTRGEKNEGNITHLLTKKKKKNIGHGKCF